MMRLLILADGRSPITRSWIGGLLRVGVEVHLVSTFGCQPLPQLASLHHLPVAFSGQGIRQSDGSIRPPGGAGWMRWRAWIRHWLGPFTLPGAARKLRTLIAEIDPDLIHGMRIPFEGMLAAQARPVVPWVVSTWGNDFTLHARATPLMAARTRQVMKSVHGLHTDTERDLRLAVGFGFDPVKPSVVLPGSGGLDLELFHPEVGEADEDLMDKADLGSLPAEGHIVVNPRGFRGYIRNDTFFLAIPLILQQQPDTRFICPAMQGEREAENWIERLGIESKVHLLPRLAPVDMAALFRKATVMVSPSEHDGTPNSLLEAMACGCFPVVGNLDSLREWISEGENGLLVDPASPSQLARAVLRALREEGLRQSAAEANLEIIAQRADRDRVITDALALYHRVL